jgi:outer membrane protein assembly factor BamB
LAIGVRLARLRRATAQASRRIEILLDEARSVRFHAPPALDFDASPIRFGASDMSILRSSRYTVSWSWAVLVALLPLGGGVGAAEKGDEWPQFRGAGGKGVSESRGLPVTWSAQENLAWKTALPGPGSSSPIIVNGRVFLTCYTGYNVPGEPGGSPDQLARHVLAIDAQSGKVLWSKPFPAKLPEQPRIRENHGYASSTMAADAERLFAFFGKSGACALDHDGNQLWHADVGSNLNGWGSGASPVVYGDLLIVNASIESESLVALDKKTGKEVWRAGGVRDAWNVPIIVSRPGGKDELVVAMFRKVLGFDPKTGEQLWSCDTGIDWYMVPSLVAHDDVVYCIGGRTGGALAVRVGGRGDVTRTHRVWTGRRGSNVSSPVYHDGHLYWMHENQEIAYCAEARTGQVVYEERVGRVGQIYAPALLADGKVYYLSRTGETVVLAAKPQFEKLAQNSLRDGGTFNAGPAVSGSRIYIRSERALYCLEQKK